MAYKRIITLIANRIYAMKRTSVTYSKVEEMVARLIDYIMMINTFTEDDTWIEVFHRSTGEVEIPQDFVDYILPNSVRYQDDRLYPDLLKRGSEQFLQDREFSKKENIPVQVKDNHTVADIMDDMLQEQDKIDVDEARKYQAVKAGMNYSDYINVVYELYNVMKIRPTFVTLQSLRKNLTLSDIQDRVVINKRLAYYGKPVIPISIRFNLKPLVGDKLPNTRAEIVVERYIDEMFRSV